ncbi:MAG: hypothetical protein OMM_05145 [Candidatus Magnetoglobus multicellularis str. Araruama]|uniref:Leucine-binding protein domain-containing protein n=1 Tax=Candidatus Magnetoglobus multicellularis str. Araruama TaxID=890399 RepID=A0A1V1NXY9_9BACT|nr:MAG: hypothetical protein OMM_05145 [Candidatus Magnetoglobus multicellularis str. Araruama]
MVFRIIPDNIFQSTMLAHFVKSNFNNNNVFVIFDKDEYGTELANTFIQSLKRMKITTVKKWGFTSGLTETPNELNRITTELTLKYNSGVVFIATHGAEAIKLITSLKYPTSKFTILGPDSFSSFSFINSFNDYPRERAKMGYYTDNIYTVVSSLYNIQNSKTHAFNCAYKKFTKNIHPLFQVHITMPYLLLRIQ